MNAHADTARDEAVRHMRSATQAVRYGEDDNAIAHLIDALVMLGRARAFADIAADLPEFLGIGDEP